MASNTSKAKVFCIGHNKTGTTSLAAALREFGYKMGRQKTAEQLLEEWGKRNFTPIIQYCESADAFQDVPFSLEYTYQALDQAFSGSKFILTIRDNGDQWYDSLMRFHTNLVGKNRLPTAADLQEFSYRYPGWIWRYHQLVWNATDSNVYDKSICINQYERHNAQIRDYFKCRPNDLLVLNLREADAARKLLLFLGIDKTSFVIPHLNRST